jgi:hypothetical protein
MLPFQGQKEIHAKVNEAFVKSEPLEVLRIKDYQPLAGL